MKMNLVEHLRCLKILKGYLGIWASISDGYIENKEFFFKSKNKTVITSVCRKANVVIVYYIA